MTNMTELDQELLLSDLRRDCPGYEFSAFDTQNLCDLRLLVIKDPGEAGDIDDWLVNVVYPLRKNKIKPIMKQYNAQYKCRVMFRRGDQFVLYSMWPEVFSHFGEEVACEWCGSDEDLHCMGENPHVDAIIEYLQNTPNLVL